MRFAIRSFEVEVGLWAVYVKLPGLVEGWIAPGETTFNRC